MNKYYFDANAKDVIDGYIRNGELKISEPNTTEEAIENIINYPYRGLDFLDKKWCSDKSVVKAAIMFISPYQIFRASYSLKNDPELVSVAIDHATLSPITFMFDLVSNGTRVENLPKVETLPFEIVDTLINVQLKYEDAASKEKVKIKSKYNKLINV